MPQRSNPRVRRSLSLFAIIESLQRRLERQGLSADTVDDAVVNALTLAAHAKA
jgi:hypothetical protein